MILPSVTVILTWTGPQRVSTESPVTVLVAVAAELEELDELDGVDEPVELAGELEVGSVPAAGGAVPTAAGTAATDVVWVLNDSRPTRPAMVANRARAVRRMSGSPAQNSKDSWWI